MKKVHEVGEKNFEEEKDNYVLTWKSNQKIMHCIIQIENSNYRINKTKFSSFPSLIQYYMRKPEDDVYHLTRELRNPKIDEAVGIRNSRRDQPESLSWYHGTVDNKVFSVSSFSFTHVCFKENKRTFEQTSNWKIFSTEKR